jgi:hypothetical protein
MVRNKMKNIIPLISSGTAGPLGVKHLPRLWLKALLSATGNLPEGYKDIRPGFDYMVLEGLGIDPESAREFIIGNRPTYLSFEKWVCEQPNADISDANISKINDLVENKTKSPESRIGILKDNGLSEDSPIESSIMLNNLDDWKSIHAQITE